MACFTPKNNAYCSPNVNAFLDTDVLSFVQKVRKELVAIKLSLWCEKLFPK